MQRDGKRSQANFFLHCISDHTHAARKQSAHTKSGFLQNLTTKHKCHSTRFPVHTTQCLFIFARKFVTQIQTPIGHKVVSMPIIIGMSICATPNCTNQFDLANHVGLASIDGGSNVAPC